MKLMEINNNKEKRVFYSYLAIFLISGVFIAFAGYQYHKNFKKHFKANIENQLSIIADLKVGEIEHWLEERRGDADVMFKNEVFSNLIKRYLDNPNDIVIKSEIQNWMKEFQTAFNYNAIILTDPHLIKKLIIPEETERPQAYISPGNIDSLNAGKIVFEDFYRDDFKQKIFLKLLVPILDVKKLIGIIELRIDPKTFLYPMLEKWPVVSETSETIILRRDGNEAVYLNELRFQKNSALNLRISLERTNVPAVRAVLGQEGFLEGIGYNGKDVVAHINKIPHSPWYIITKTDTNEAYEALRKNFWLTVVFSFGIFLLSGMSLGFLRRNQRTLIYKDRIKSAEELQKLNLAIYNSQDVVFLTDKEGTITYINPQFTNIYGYTADEVVGVTTPRILNSRIYKREDHKSLWDALLNKQSIPTTEYFNKCKDGNIVQIEGSANPVINNNGDIIGFLGVQRDITGRKRAELEKQVIYEIIHGITTTGNINELLKLIHQSLGKVLYADNIFVALHDINTGLFGFPYWVDKFDPIPEPTAMRKSLTAYVFRTGKPVLFSQELFRQLKEQNEVELVGSPSPSWIGIPLETPSKIIGVLVLQHYEKENVYSESDLKFITSMGSQVAFAIERKQIEEELTESEIKLKVILQSTADGILAVDSKGKVIKTNNRFAKMWQIPKKLIDSGDDRALISFILKQLANPDEFISKVQKLYNSTDEDLDHLYFKDGRTFERFSAPLIRDNSLIGRVWSFRDITNARQAEENIKKNNEELSKANGEKDKFFSIIAHDLRGPLSAFVSVTQMLTENVRSMTMEEIEDISISMKDDASNIYGLLENLLEWSRLKRGLMEFDPVKFNLNESINTSTRILSGTASKKEIKIIISVPENLEVTADNHMFDSIIRNLVSNAVKFSFSGGIVEVSAYQNQDKSIEVRINDSGIGMPAGLKSKLFMMNENTGRKGTEGEASSGLGLLLCKEFIDKHNGKIWAESEEGKGTSFYFTIPERNS
jgi:PAS domain S-box-containing protein